MSSSSVLGSVLDMGRSAYRALPGDVRSRVRPLVNRHLGPKVEMRHLAIGDGDAPGRPAIRPFVIEAPTDLYIAKMIFKKGVGAYERYALDAFMAVLDQAGPGDVLDVGANVGLYGFLAAARGERRVYAFEPTPRIAASVRRSARLGRLPVHVVEAALGDRTGTATLYLSDRTDASNSLNPSFRPSTTQVDVPAFTLDDFCTRRGITPAVIKVDTETTEPAVLRGARGTIARHRPWIFVEALEGIGIGELDAAMAGLDYTAYHLDGPGPRPVADGIVGHGDHFMFLLAPEPVRESVWAAMNEWRPTLERIRVDQDLVPVSRGVLEPALRPPA